MCIMLDVDHINYNLCFISQAVSNETVQKLREQGYPTPLTTAKSKYDNF